MNDEIKPGDRFECLLLSGVIASETIVTADENQGGGYWSIKAKNGHWYLGDPKYFKRLPRENAVTVGSRWRWNNNVIGPQKELTVALVWPSGRVRCSDGFDTSTDALMEHAERLPDVATADFKLCRGCSCVLDGNMSTGALVSVDGVAWFCGPCFKAGPLADKAVPPDSVVHVSLKPTPAPSPDEAWAEHLRQEAKIAAEMQTLDNSWPAFRQGPPPLRGVKWTEPSPTGLGAIACRMVGKLTR